MNLASKLLAEFGKWKEKKHLSGHVTQNLLKYFKGGNLFLEIKPRGSKPSVVGYNVLKPKTQMNPNNCTEKLLEKELQSSKDTICKTLHKLKK